MTFHISGKVNQPTVLVRGTENLHVTLEEDRVAQNFVLCSFKRRRFMDLPPSFLHMVAGNIITAKS